MFENEVLKKAKPYFTEFLFPKITILGRDVVTVEGYKSVVFMDGAQIVFGLKKGVVKITGENLRLVSVYSDGSIVGGTVTGVKYDV